MIIYLLIWVLAIIWSIVFSRKIIKKGTKIEIIRDSGVVALSFIAGGWALIYFEFEYEIYERTVLLFLVLILGIGIVASSSLFIGKVVRKNKHSINCISN
jgi:hypothetical protein